MICHGPQLTIDSVKFAHMQQDMLPLRSVVPSDELRKNSTLLSGCHFEATENDDQTGTEKKSWCNLQFIFQSFRTISRLICNKLLTHLHAVSQNFGPPMEIERIWWINVDLYNGERNCKSLNTDASQMSCMQSLTLKPKCPGRSLLMSYSNKSGLHIIKIPERNTNFKWEHT